MASQPQDTSFDDLSYDMIFQSFSRLSFDELKNIAQTNEHLRRIVKDIRESRINLAEEVNTKFTNIINQFYKTNEDNKNAQVSDQFDLNINIGVNDTVKIYITVYLQGDVEFSMSKQYTNLTVFNNYKFNNDSRDNKCLQRNQNNYTFKEAIEALIIEYNNSKNGKNAPYKWSDPKNQKSLDAYIATTNKIIDFGSMSLTDKTYGTLYGYKNLSLKHELISSIDDYKIYKEKNNNSNVKDYSDCINAVNEFIKVLNRVSQPMTAGKMSHKNKFTRTSQKVNTKYGKRTVYLNQRKTKYVKINNSWKLLSSMT